MTDTTTWPRRLRRAEAARYLREVHGVPLSEKTLGNRNASGLEPRPEYLGTIPYYRPEALDAWAATAFTQESPVAVTRRKVAALQAEDLAQRKVRARSEPAGDRPSVPEGVATV
jgi:hypothetical protein